MEKARSTKRQVFNLCLYYTLSPMGMAIYTTFIGVYLSSVGMGDAQIGQILAIGPLVALLAQPLWGAAGDRAPTKNLLLRLLLVGSAGVLLLYPLGSSFVYFLFVASLYSFLQCSISPLGETIALEYLTGNGLHFGKVRVFGTIGYCLAVFLCGFLFTGENNQYGLIFPIAAMGYLVVVAATAGLPRVRGHRKKGEGASLFQVLKNYRMLVLLFLALVLNITIGIYYSFFSVYLSKELHCDGFMVSLAIALGSFVEIPFLVKGDQIYKKLGAMKLLMLSGGITAVRWVLLGFITNPYLILVTQVFHAAGFIVLLFAVAVYINEIMPPELKATGQMLANVVAFGLSRIVASLLGGQLVEALGSYRPLFLIMAVINVAGMVIAALLLRFAPKKERTPAPL